MIRSQSLVLMFLASLTMHSASSRLPAEVRGVEVEFRIDDKSVRGPKQILIQSQGKRAELEIRSDVSAVDDRAPKHVRVVVFPSWSTSGDTRVPVSITARFKGRVLCFESVKLWDGIGRLTFQIDRAPFSDDVAWALGDRRSQADGDEAHALFLDPVDGDGYVMAHLAKKTK